MNAPFYYDIVCPYAYMAFSLLNRSKVFASNRLTLKPILLGGLFKEMGVETDPNRSLSKLRSDYVREDIKRQAEYFGVPLQFHPRHPVSTVHAQRMLAACDEDKRAVLSARLYEMYWHKNIDIDDETNFSPLKAEFALSDECLIDAKDKLRSLTKEAFDNQVFGVPTIVHNGQRYFGADRLELIQKDLGISLPNAEWKPSPPIDFYFDFSSPYSYLGYAEVKKAVARGTQFVMKPVLLGALFKEIGTTNIPMLSAHPHKASYYLKDMQDWAAHRNVPFTFNSRFPLRTVTSLRIALANPNTIDSIFSAAWALNLDIGDDAILSGVLDKAGFGQENLLERSQEDFIKDKLKENTAEALARGVFGVPTFFVQGHKIFGQDRFLWMRREIEKLTDF